MNPFDEFLLVLEARHPDVAAQAGCMQALLRILAIGNQEVVQELQWYSAEMRKQMSLQSATTKED